MSLNKVCIIAANNSITEDNKVIDYIQLASIAAERVKYFLDLPTVIITDSSEEAAKYSIFYGVIEHTPKKVSKRNMIAGSNTIQYKWYNDCRVDAYDLTKGLADKVLMIDADYMVASDQLKNWLNNDYSFLIFDDVKDVTNSKIYESSKYFPSNDITQRWATAICFDHSEQSNVIFNTAKMIRENYNFYAIMFGLSPAVYRNDLAFSIACHLHNIPCNSYEPLYNIPPGSEIRYLNHLNSWIVMNGQKAILWEHDMHVLNKNYAIDIHLMNQLRLKNVAA